MTVDFLVELFVGKYGRQPPVVAGRPPRHEVVVVGGGGGAVMMSMMSRWRAFLADDGSFFSLHFCFCCCYCCCRFVERSHWELAAVVVVLNPHEVAAVQAGVRLLGSLLLIAGERVLRLALIL